MVGSTGTEIGSIHSFVKPHFYPRQAKDAIDFPEMVNQISNLYVPGKSCFVHGSMMILRLWKQAVNDMELKIPSVSTIVGI